MKRVVFLMVALVVSTLNACKESDPPLPDNLVQFESTEQGMDAATKESTIKLKLSRAVDAATTVTIQVTPTGITYGTQFSTTPATTSNVLSVTVPAGSSEGSFKLTKADNIILSGTETIDFAISSATSPVLVGTNKGLKIKFASIVSSGSTLTLDGGTGGSSAVNAVFVDLSNNTPTAIKRASWDLGFFAGSDYRVIINNMTGAAATVLNKTDLTQVTAADTVGLNLTLGFDPSGLKLVDDVSGDITKTVIAAVSATDADNKVYIINRGTSGGTPAKGWVKVRILRNGTTGYTLQYAGIKETTFKTVTVTKDAAYNFQYVSFDTGATVSVEPPKASWDIVWGGMMNKTSDGTNDIAYYFADLVVINQLGGVTAAEVLTSAVTYDAYAESNIATTTFKNDKFVIGANWRVASQTSTGVRTDRFYVIKDAAGNVYKLKFLSFATQDGGERGKPKFEFKLVKQA